MTLLIIVADLLLRSKSVMSEILTDGAVVDMVNSTFGKGTIRLAVQGSGKIKNAKQMQSPRYTTRWDEIPTVTIK